MERKNTRILAKQFKSAIVRDMSCLNGTQFEDLCKVILYLILDRDDILHKGCNLNGKPVSCAVDTKTEDCRIVGQSGTDTDYFTKANLEKPMGDIRGTMKNDPLCEVLYLFSNQRATDAQHTSLVAKINADKLKPKFEVKVYDAEKIAETIYDNVNSPKCNDVWQYLTESHLFYAIYPKQNSIPQSSAHYIPRIKESTELQALLRNQPVVEVVGVSGIGKSEFAKQAAKEISQDFESLLWVNGNDFGNLDSVRICQFGNDINLRFALENYKCLVIVDNLNKAVSEFNEAFQNANRHDSKCIITSLKQHLENKQTYCLPYMEDELVGKYIDGFNLGLSESERKGLVALVAGYPLAINMICSSVKNGHFTIGEMLADGALQDMEEEHDQKLSKRIVGKIYVQYACDLDLLAYIDCLNISSEFLKEIFGPIKFKNLCQYSILQQDDVYTVRIHQVVLDAIKSMAKLPNIKDLANKTSCYLDEKNRQKDIPFFNLFRHNASFIDKVCQNAETSDEQKKVILYSRLQAENTFGDPSRYVSLINELTLQPAESLYDCLLMAERNEIELSTTNRENINEKARNMIVELCGVLENATSKDIKFELLHHIGKLYAKLKDEKKAKQYFEQALTIRPKAYATMLQLAKIASISKPPDTVKAKEYVSAILDDNIKGCNVPLTIILACYSDFLSKKPYADLADKYIANDFEDFSEVILNSLLSFNNQAVPTLASLAYTFAYEKPEFMREAIELLQELPAASTDNTYIKAYAKLKAVEYKLENDKSTDKAKIVLASAKHYFGLLKLEEKDKRQNNDYMRKRYQELLMDAEDWNGALNFSTCFDDKESVFFFQNLAKIYRGLHDFDNAISNIDKAISKTTDIDYKSSFLWNKAEIMHDMGDNTCVQILQEAISMRKDDKAKGEWMEKQKEWVKDQTSTEHHMLCI